MKEGQLRRENSRRLIPLFLFLLCALLTFHPTLRGMEPEDKTLPELHLGNADLRTVFRSLAEFGGFRILLGSTVRGEVSLPLKPGLTAQALVELLAELHGYTCQWVAGTALIGADPDALAPRTPRHYQWSSADEDSIYPSSTEGPFSGGNRTESNPYGRGSFRR